MIDIQTHCYNIIKYRSKHKHPNEIIHKLLNSSSEYNYTNTNVTKINYDIQNIFNTYNKYKIDTRVTTVNNIIDYLILELDIFCLNTTYLNYDVCVHILSYQLPIVSKIEHSKNVVKYTSTFLTIPYGIQSYYHHEIIYVDNSDNSYSDDGTDIYLKGTVTHYIKEKLVLSILMTHNKNNDICMSKKECKKYNYHGSVKYIEISPYIVYDTENIYCGIIKHNDCIKFETIVLKNDKKSWNNETKIMFPQLNNFFDF
jgi:hypothetical protein